MRNWTALRKEKKVIADCVQQNNHLTNWLNTDEEASQTQVDWEECRLNQQKTSWNKNSTADEDKSNVKSSLKELNHESENDWCSTIKENTQKEQSEQLKFDESFIMMIWFVETNQCRITTQETVRKKNKSHVTHITYEVINHQEEWW